MTLIIETINLGDGITIIRIPPNDKPIEIVIPEHLEKYIEIKET